MHKLLTGAVVVAVSSAILISLWKFWDFTGNPIGLYVFCVFMIILNAVYGEHVCAGKPASWKDNLNVAVLGCLVALACLTGVPARKILYFLYVPLVLIVLIDRLEVFKISDKEQLIRC